MPSPKGFTFTFGGAGTSHELLVAPGETVQYYLNFEGANEGICRIRLQYTQNGGQIWKTEKDLAGTNIDHTGTAGSTLSGLVAHGFLKNESPKAKVYRWQCVSMDRDNSANAVTYLSKHEIVSGRLKLDQGLYIIWDTDAPLDGIDGDGADYADNGSIYIHIDGSAIYMNVGDDRMPNWDQLSTS